MRRRVLFYGFVALNIGFAVALVMLVARSGTQSPPPPPATLSSLRNAAQPASSNTPAGKPEGEKPAQAQPAAALQPAAAVTNATPPAAAAATRVAPAGKTYGWQDIGTPQYLTYLDNLRATGCPDKLVRMIVFNDANEQFNEKRLQAAITHDFKWWQMDSSLSTGGYNPEYQGKMQALVLERRDVLTRLLGENWEQEDKLPSLATHTVALTGPVLGALPLDLYMGVQEICARSMSRHQDYLMGRFNEGQASSQVELAKLRDMTRKDLSVILDRDQLEEFLLRFSHNSSKLRQDLRGLGVTPDDFRKIFRATDQIDHQIQLEYGSEEALSAGQREQLTRQREQAVASVLGQDKYAQLILSRDPMYRQAQMMVMNSGAADTVTQQVYELLKSAQTRRAQVQSNTEMTPDQKQTAIIEINRDQMQRQRALLTPRSN